MAIEKKHVIRGEKVMVWFTEGKIMGRGDNVIVEKLFICPYIFPSKFAKIVFMVNFPVNF